MRLSGLAFKVCRISHPCFLAVESSERITAKSIAPSMERKPPEIFWRKLHIGMDANTGEIVATALTTNDVEDPSQVGPLLDQVEKPVASFTGEAPMTRIASIAPLSITIPMQR